MLALRIQKERTEVIINQLFEKDLVDRNKKIVKDGSHVIIPLKSRPQENFESAEIIEVADTGSRKSSKPIKRIKESLDIPDELLNFIPYKWELVGNILIFKLHPALKDKKIQIAEAYATVLNAKTVFEDIAGIKDEFREPELEKIIGDDSVTIHKENGVSYKFDVAKLMFSSGNKHERMKIAEINMQGEFVLDMFAGIGYFTLPIAKYDNPRKVISCEKNPVAYRYLLDNIRLNRLDNVKPILIDCRDLELDEKVDRIVMGYVKDTHRFLFKAFELISDNGIVHYHEACPVYLLPDKPIKKVKDIANTYFNDIRIENYRVVKSYAPKVQHIAFDIHIQ